MKPKQYIHEQLFSNKGFINFIYVLIVLNVAALVLESYKPIAKRYQAFFDIFELISVIVFTFEYLARLWTSNISSSSGRHRFATSYYGIIDLLAILPFYLPMVFPFDLRIVRVLRLFRLLRVLKLGRFNKSMKLITSVVKETRSELAVTFFVAFILLLLSSTIMYYVECDSQPEKFASIGHSFWWAIATLTTVGYGDVYPITSAGKFISGIIAIIGIGFVALPTGILSSAFIEKINEDKKKSQSCPDCERKILGNELCK